MRITFNTGRLYSADGQLISAYYDTDKCEMYFTDHSRLIWGQFTYSAGTRYSAWMNSPRLMAKVVMDHYDAGKYTMSIREVHPCPETFNFKY